MCRWLAYSGSAVQIEEFLLKPKHSLVDQSLHSRLGAETTNGDGFGLGWYGVGDTPGVFHSVEPAWNDRNLKDIARHLRSSLVFAHVRAATGGPIQQSNCHPFRHGNWLWMHNGLIREFATVKRDLVLAVDPSLYPEIEGSTDSEVFFYLALTLGLEDDPASGRRARRRLHRGDRSAPRHRATDPDDGRDDERFERVGVPVFERGCIEIPLPQHGDGDTPGAVSRQPGAPWALGRDEDDRLGAARRPRGRLDRGAGVDLHRRLRGQDERRPFTPRSH